MGFALAFLAVERSYSDQKESKKGAGSKAAAKASSAKQDAKTQKQKKKSKRRLPNYYAQVGLSGEQREKIYGLQMKYRTQLEELEKQIAVLKTKRDTEIHAVLTDSQKRRLAELLDAAKKKRESRKKKPKPAKTTKGSE